MAETGIFDEWRTRNEQRRYPFADDVLLTDAATGQRLSDAAFVDAMFYPINISGDLYLSKIAVSESKAYISDSNGVVATADIDYADLRTLNFYDSYGRLTGIMVPGSYFSEIDTDRTFVQSAASFAQACVAPQVYDCLGGVLLPDGTLVSGQIFWEGENGIQVTTEYIDSVPVIRIDAVGTTELPACLPLTAPVKCIKVQQIGTGGTLMISQDENVISLATPYMLQDFCGMFPTLPDSEGHLPIDRDVCIIIPPVPCTPPAPFTGICPTGSYPDYFIWTLTDTLGVALVQQDPVFSQESASQFAIDSNGVNLPLRPKQGVQLFMKGVQGG